MHATGEFFACRIRDENEGGTVVHLREARGCDCGCLLGSGAQQAVGTASMECARDRRVAVLCLCVYGGVGLCVEGGD
jgi:hypothetical protein